MWHDKLYFSQLIFLPGIFPGKYNKINQLLLTKRIIINEGSYDNCRRKQDFRGFYFTAMKTKTPGNTDKSSVSAFGKRKVGEGWQGGSRRRHGL